jgi:hypothetical protein
LKVKIVITNVEDFGLTMRKIVSPLLNPLNFITSKYGVFHTALIVGPFYLDWNESELIIPKTIMKSKRSFMTIDVAEIPIINGDMDEISQKLAEVVHEWNVFHRYALFRSVRKGNCQDFIESVFDKLDIKFTPTPGGKFQIHI